jgi:hypothetical protein
VETHANRNQLKLNIWHINNFASFPHSFFLHIYNECLVYAYNFFAIYNSLTSQLLLNYMTFYLLLACCIGAFFFLSYSIFSASDGSISQRYLEQGNINLYLYRRKKKRERKKIKKLTGYHAISVVINIEMKKKGEEIVSSHSLYTKMRLFLLLLLPSCRGTACTHASRHSVI